MNTILASFDNFDNAARAGGALLDHGIKKEDFSLLAGASHQQRFQIENEDVEDLEGKIKSGVTTTTAADAARGAADGGGAGLVLGALGALACLFIPGYGIVAGGGALATALAAAAGTAVGGVAVGGVAGYLKDLGVKEAAAQNIESTFRDEGVVIAVRFPKGSELEAKTLGILEKYNANEIHVTEREPSSLRSGK